jgi:branched-chain amino acid transport system permease protein
MVDFGILIQVLFYGVYAGCIYILLATGLNLIFGVMKIVNFAHGEFLMLGAYITATIFIFTGLNPYAIILFSMATFILLGVIIERLCFRPILGTGKLNEIFLSLGLIYLIQNTVARVWTDNWKEISSPYGTEIIPLGPIQMPIAILIALYLFLKKTSVGKALRATSQNRKGAMLVGINVERMDMLSFGIGSALAAAAGTLWAVSGQQFNPYIGSGHAINAFAIIIIGGLGSIPGAIIGGFLLGIAEHGARLFLGGIWKDAISFIILILVLIVKPTGLFGESGE